MGVAAELVPAAIKQAVAEPGDGTLALVIGAGCSTELPTGLPLGSECSKEAFRRLVADGELAEDECAHPDDLSQLAEVVYQRHTTQRPLVQRLPRKEYRGRQPNEGCRIAAALMRERAIRYVLTLNFDLAMSNALASVDAGEEVAQLQGPEDHSQLAAISLIYLHRNVNADAEEWVLRLETGEEIWKDTWEEVVAKLVVATPVTVFAGLGTPVGVIIESTKRVRQALNADDTFQVDPGDHAGSVYARELGIPPERFIQLGWGDFMRVLGDRICEEHRAALLSACTSLGAQPGMSSEPSAPAICGQLAQLGLLGSGKLRARWTLRKSSYQPARGTDLELLADLVLLVALLGRVTSTTPMLHDDGIVELWADNSRRIAVLAFATGSGTLRWAVAEGRISDMPWGERPAGPQAVILTAVTGESEDLTPPQDLVSIDPEHSIVRRPTDLPLLRADDLRADPGRISELITA